MEAPCKNKPFGILEVPWVLRAWNSGILEGVLQNNFAGMVEAPWKQSTWNNGSLYEEPLRWNSGMKACKTDPLECCRRSIPIFKHSITFFFL